MLFHVVSASSELSPEAAVGAAVNSTVGFASEAKSMHIILLGVAKTGNIWRALVRVVVEPEIEPEDDSAEQAHKRHLKHEEEERELQKREKDVLKHLVVHFHALEDLGLVYGDIEFPYKEYTLHLLKEGALWDNVQDHFPDIDFYEAVHAAPRPHPEESPAELKHTLDQEIDMLRKLKKPRAALALNEEL